MFLRLELPAQLPGSAAGQLIGFPVKFTANVRDGENERTGQFHANPVQRVQPRAAAVVFARHLPNDHFRIRIDVNGAGFQSEGDLQGFQ